MENIEKKEDNRQPKQTELTLFQKVALEGEVSMCYESAFHDADMEYFTYILLACTPQEYMPYYMKEANKYVSEETITNCYRYVINDIFPKNLYINKVITDIKTCVGVSDSCLKDRLPKFPKEVIKSKFLAYIRNLEFLVPSVLRELFFVIITEESDTLDFLTDIAFAFNTELVGREDKITDTDKLVRALQSSVVDMCVSSFGKELELVKEHNRVDENDILNFVNSILREGVSEKKVTKTFVVNKIDKATRNIVFTKEFTSQDKAISYIKNIGKDYPDILQRYEFVIITQSDGEK